MSAGVKGPQAAAGLSSYYSSKIEELELLIRDKTQNLRRLEAQRNDLNSRGGYILALSIHLYHE